MRSTVHGYNIAYEANRVQEYDRDIKIDKKQWPVDGLRQLIAAVDRKLPVCKEFVEACVNDESNLCVQPYNRFMDTLVCAIYVSGVQGRQRAIGMLTLDEYNKAMDDEVEPSNTKFKTATRYGRQVRYYL